MRLPWNRNFSTKRLLAIMFMLLVGGLYLPFLSNPMIFDDLGLMGQIEKNAELSSVVNLRGLPYFTLGATWVFFGENLPIFRLQNLLLHCLNVWLVWRLLRLWGELFLLDAEHKARFARGAYWAAAIFAVHPLAVYGAGYLVQRSILMATLFTLLMQLTYLRGLIESNKRYLAFAVFAYLLAAFSKEHSLMAPLILLPLTWLFRAKSVLSLRVLVVTWLGFLAVALLVVLHVKGILGRPYEPDAGALFLQQGMVKDARELHILSVLTQAGLFFKYLLLMLLPNPAWMSIDMRETFLLSWKEWVNWGGVAAFIVYGVFSLWCLLKGGGRGLFGLALLYPWCYFIVEFSSIRIQEIFVLYRTYLWLPGCIMLFALMLSFWPVRRHLLVGGLLVVFLIPLAWNRMWIFADDFRVWDDAVSLLHGEDRLGAARTYYGRAHALAAKKNWEAAIVDYKKSLSLKPDNPEAQLALASAYYGNKRYYDALAELDKVIVARPMNAKAHYNKGIVLKKMGDTKAGMSEIQKSCDLGAVVACATLVLGKPNKDVSN